jgi:hypothetical protein
MSDDRIGWEIAGRFYPHNGTQALRHGDFALIREVTGLSLDEFDRGDDPLATETGWIAVAIWQSNPDMRRDQVRTFVEQLPAEAAKRVGWEAEETDVPLAPEGSPASGSSSSDSDSPPADDSSPSASPSTTKSPEEQTQEPLTRNGSGDQQSVTGVMSDLETSDHLRSSAG